MRAEAIRRIVVADCEGAPVGIARVDGAHFIQLAGELYEVGDRLGDAAPGQAFLAD